MIIEKFAYPKLLKFFEENYQSLVVLANPFAAATIPFIILGVSSTAYGITELINLYKFRKKVEKGMPTDVVIEDVTPIEE